jgi:hypothetical protein
MVYQFGGIRRLRIYDVRKNNYYVDTHERADNVSYRWAFVRRSLERELRMYRWIQIPLERAVNLEKKGEVMEGSGYEYTDVETGERMKEYHVDASRVFQKELNEDPACKYGGNKSVRKRPEDKMLVCFGHDECIFKKNAFANRHWVGANGERPIVPKDDGCGIMISAFQSREFGFGFMDLTDDELRRVNEYRMRPENTRYADEDAAKEATGSEEKKPLTGHPFVEYFEYGVKNEGYWTYDHFVVQMEDCMDIMKCLYAEEFDVMFLVDHSCGHDRQREDGLNVNRMNVEYGGTQACMRDTEIKTAFGYLGAHDPQLKVGDIQRMSYVAGDKRYGKVPPGRD